MCGGRAGRGWVGGGATGSSQCWSVGQPVQSSLLPTMASVVIVWGLDSTLLCMNLKTYFWLNIKCGAYYVTYIFRFISNNLWNGRGAFIKG